MGELLIRPQTDYGLYKGWQFFGEVTTRSNNLWGETLEYGEFYHHIGLGYNADKWGFRAMLMNPFSVKGYSIETKDLSARQTYQQ